MDNPNFRVNAHNRICTPSIVRLIPDPNNKSLAVGQPLSMPEYFIRIRGMNAKDRFAGLGIGKDNRRPWSLRREKACILAVVMLSLLLCHVSFVGRQGSRTKFRSGSTRPTEVMLFHIKVSITFICWALIPCADKKSSLIREKRITCQPSGWEIDANRHFPPIPNLWFKDNNGIKRCHCHMIHRVPYAKHEDLSVRRKKRPRLLVLLVSGCKGKPPDFFHLMIDQHKRSKQDVFFLIPCALFEEYVIL